MSEAQTSIDNLSAAVDAARGRLAEMETPAAGIKTYDTSTGAADAADQIRQRWQETAEAGDTVETAAKKIRAKQAEAAASGPTPDDLAAAQAELGRRVSEHAGRPIDLNKPEWTGENKDQAKSARETAKALGDYQAARAAELEQILGEQAVEKAWAARSETQPTTEAPQVEQPAHPHPLAVERWQMETERQALHTLQQATQAEVLLAAQLQQAGANHRAQFPDVTHESHIDRLDPQRRAAFMASYQN